MKSKPGAWSKYRFRISGRELLDKGDSVISNGHKSGHSGEAQLPASNAGTLKSSDVG